MGELLANAANPKGLQPSGFAEAEPGGKGELIPVGGNVMGAFGETGARKVAKLAWNNRVNGFSSKR